MMTTDAQIVAALLSTCSELKISYNRDNSVKAIRAVFKPSTETSVGYRVQVRQQLETLVPFIDVHTKKGK